MTPEQKMAKRIQDLEAALREIVEICNASDGRVAKFYGMLAERALKNK
jgi:hypothetical protein